MAHNASASLKRMRTGMSQVETAESIRETDVVYMSSLVADLVEHDIFHAGGLVSECQ